MVDIINTPAKSEGEGTGALIGGIVLVMLAMLFIFYGFPALRGSAQNVTPEAQVQQAPNTEVVEGGSMNIPDEININMDKTQE